MAELLKSYASIRSPGGSQATSGPHTHARIMFDIMQDVHKVTIMTTQSLNHDTCTRPSCELYDLVIDMNWDAVVQHAKERPQDAAFEDGEWHETPLFSALQNSPSEQAIRALLQAYPPAVRMGSKNGDLPLHIACRWRASAKVICALLDHDQSTASIATKYGKTPLTALWEGYNKSGKDQEIYQATCEKSKVLLEAIARSHRLLSGENGASPLLLHASMHIACPDALLYLVMKEYKHQISNRDQQGRLPLHIAADVGIPSRRKLHKCVIEELIASYPEAASIEDPVNGRLALHSMASNPVYSWNEMQVVFRAHPQAMSTRDPVTGLLPFQLAPSTETSFCLLTAQPDVLVSCSPLVSREKEEKEISKCVTISHSVVVGLLSMAIAACVVAAAKTAR